jgi:hypothetical protein
LTHIGRLLVSVAGALMSLYGGFASQPAVRAGLVGPVTLTPYRTATVAS